MKGLLLAIVVVQLVCHAPRTGLNIYEMVMVRICRTFLIDLLPSFLSHCAGFPRLPSVLGRALVDRRLSSSPRRRRLLQRRHRGRPGWTQVKK